MYLLDSVILIDHFNGIDKASRFLSQHQKEISISAITRAEVLTGFDIEDLPAAKQLLNHLPNIPIDKAEADLAAELRRQYRWKLPDALQAALAINYRATLVTRNTEDFPPDRHNFVFLPYQL